MTDQDEKRPLSRRELRLREMAAAGLQAEAEEAPQPPSDTSLEASESVEPDYEVDIPLLDEHGKPRSRRELRELREQAIAELRAAAAENNVEEPEGKAGLKSEPAETVAFDVAAQEVGAEAEAEAEFEPEAMTSLGGDVAQGNDQPVTDDSPAESEFDALLQQAADEEAGLAEQVEASKAAIPSNGENSPVEHEPALEVEPAPEADPASEAEPASELSVESEADADFDSETGAELIAGSEPVTASEFSIGAAAVEDGARKFESTPPAPVSAATGQAYSFPDITPLDEGQSIFDDPAIQVMGTTSSKPGVGLDSSHDFDELITRAVAQEGAASTTNTSALILPTMPESDSLTGSIGETGELFITGSFDLPKSLSETGGHASLHDSVDAEPFDELGFVEAAPTGTMAPVSASRAVSARAGQGPLVAEATKDKNKMPVVLIATGGVLVLGAAGLIIWAATSGLFG